MLNSSAGFGEPGGSSFDPTREVIESAKALGERLDPVPMEELGAHLKRVAAGVSELIDAYAEVRKETESTWNSESGDRFRENVSALITHAQHVESVAQEATGIVLNSAGIAQQAKNHIADLADWQEPSSAAQALSNERSAAAASDFRADLEENLEYLIGAIDGAVDSAGGLRNASSHDELLRDPYGAGVHDPLADTVSLGLRPGRPHTPGARRMPRPRNETPLTPVGGVLNESQIAGGGGSAATAAHRLATQWLTPPATGPDHGWQPPVVGD